MTGTLEYLYEVQGTSIGFTDQSCQIRVISQCHIRTSWYQISNVADVRKAILDTFVRCEGRPPRRVNSSQRQIIFPYL